MGCPHRSQGNRLEPSTGKQTGTGAVWSAIVATLHPVTDATRKRSAPDDPLTPEFLTPALRVPMAAVVGRAVRHDDEVSQTRPDDVIAPRTAVLLVARDLPDLVPVDDRPGRCARPTDRRGRREVLERGAPVLPGHQLFALTKSTTSGTSCAALSRGLSFRDRSNECPASLNGTYVARFPSFRRTPARTSGSANGSLVPWRKSIGIFRP